MYMYAQALEKAWWRWGSEEGVTDSPKCKDFLRTEWQHAIGEFYI